MLALRTCSLRRYRIQGSLPAPASDEMAKRLTDRRFLPLAAREERTYGWVTADNLLLTRFDADTLLRGEQVALGLRIDRRRINARLLRAQLDLEVRARARAAEDGGSLRRVSRDERSELRQQLAEELMKQTSPTVEAYTVLLDTRRREARLLTLSRRAHEAFCALFSDTFEASLLPLTPFQRGVELLEGRGARPEALHALERTVFWEPVGVGAEAPAGLPADRRISS
ncbi:MAG: recombination-associated protein RdgC [Planctomycetia bacterium]